MNKVLMLLLSVTLATGTVAAQKNDNKTDSEGTVINPKKKKPKPLRQDFIILNFNWNWWFNQPDNVSVSPFSRGFEFYLMYDIPLGRSPISFAAGLGLSTENIFLNSFLRDSAGGTQNYFESIEGVINADNPSTTRSWSKYKIGTTILELPIEFRFRANPRKRNTFKFAVGFKVGYMIGLKDKYVGPDYRNGTTDLGNTVKFKTYDIPNVNLFRYGLYTRIGYSRFHLTAQYTFANFFKTGAGMDGVTPFSVGISITPF